MIQTTVICKIVFFLFQLDHKPLQGREFSPLWYLVKAFAFAHSKHLVHNYWIEF